MSILFCQTYLGLAEILAEFLLYREVPSYRQSSCTHLILISQSYHNHIEPQIVFHSWYMHNLSYIHFFLINTHNLIINGSNQTLRLQIQNSTVLYPDT